MQLDITKFSVVETHNTPGKPYDMTEKKGYTTTINLHMYSLMTSFMYSMIR